MASLTENYLYVAAIDFGTTYSGYAFSLRDDFKKDPLNIVANQTWIAGSQKHVSLKTPTCLLLDDKEELVSFGYEAENKYSNILIDHKQMNISSLVNFITCGTLFCNLQSQARTHTVLVMGLYELLGNPTT